jgi:hypothetical protein
MLSEKQAQEIVSESIKKAIPTREFQQTDSLGGGGFPKDELRDLVVTLAADKDVGIPRFQHYLDPNTIIESLSPGITVEDLTSKILELAAGKVCSNPKSPHPQKCCPYPTKCPQCGYPVL